MKLSQPALVLTATAAILLSGCDRGATKVEAQRLAEERAALEREKAALADAKAAARETANEQERLRLESERAELEREKNKLANERDAQDGADRQAKAAAEREARMAAQRRAEEEAARQREAEERQDTREAQTVDFFYDALDPYGEWIELERYGYAFRPNTNQTAMWRPYTDGGWVYTEYGWTWRSNEPFGWATYHYGRWAKLPRLGWVWIPGTEWGPAWVSWRRSSDYVGWAPLPPDAWSSKGFNSGVDSYYDIGPGLYTFLRVADFGEPTYVGRVVEPERNVTIIDNSVNITNTVYKVINNKTTVINEGPDLTVINKAARRPVQRLTVQRVNTVRPAAGGAKVEGGTLQVVAPDLKKAPATPTKPKKVKETVKATEVDHGWKEAKAEVQKVRAEAAKEARQAEQAERAEVKAPKPAPASMPAPAPAQTKPAPAPAPAPAPIPAPAPSPVQAKPAPAPDVAPVPAPGSVPGRPERPSRPQQPFQPKPGTDPAAERPTRPFAPAPVAPPKDRPGRPKRPGTPIPEPGTTPTNPPGPGAPATPEPAAENPAPPASAPAAPGVAEPIAPGQGQRPNRQRPPLNQFRQPNASPTPVMPEGAPRPGRKLKREPEQES